MPTTQPSIKAIAEMLDHAAGLLEAQGEDPFRVRAYRSAAQTRRDTKASVAEMAQADDLQAL